jgi:hypothetical protein
MRAVHGLLLGRVTFFEQMAQQVTLVILSFPTIIGFGCLQIDRLAANRAGDLGLSGEHHTAPRSRSNRTLPAFCAVRSSPLISHLCIVPLVSVSSRRPPHRGGTWA